MKIKFTLKFYLWLTLAEGFISLGLLLLIPSDPKSVWVLGISKYRLLLLGSLILPVVFVVILALKMRKDSICLAKTTKKIGVIFQWGGHLTTAIVLSLSGFISGCYFLFTALTTTDLFIQGYFVRLTPWIFWVTAVCGQTLLFLIYQNTKAWKQYTQAHGKGNTHKTFNWGNKFDLYQQDIYAIFSEGDSLQHGNNPYMRVLSLNNDLQWNQKNATYLPVFYYLAWITQEVGLDDFIQWLSFWRIVFLIANLSIAYILFYIPYHRYDSIILAILASSFWLFNQWTLHMTMIYQIDFIAIFFFLLSLTLWPKHRTFSLLSFGISLGVKQIAIFMIPLYLIWIWKSAKDPSIKHFITSTIILFSIPLLVSLPFLTWNAESFIKSILISAARNAESHFGIPSIDTLIGLTGLPAKLPMLILMAFTFLLAWKEKIHHFAAALLIMAIFVDFNSVMFRQYMTWIVPLIPLAIGNYASKSMQSKN